MVFCYLNLQFFLDAQGKELHDSASCIQKVGATAFFYL